MRLKNILRISVEMIMCQKIRFFLSAVLIGLCLFSMGYFFIFSSEGKLDKLECDRVLSKGISGTGIMQVHNPGSLEARQLKVEAYGSGMFDGIGGWDSGTMYWILSNELVLNKTESTPKVGWVAMDKTAIGTCDLEFAKIMEVPEEKWKDPNWRGLYLGWDYHNIPLGTIYEDDYRMKELTRYEVIGILKKGQVYVTPEVIGCGEGNGIFSVESWDDVVIEIMEPFVSDGIATSAWAYTPKEGFSLKDCREYIEKKAEELGVTITFGNLEEGFYAQELKHRDQQRVEKEIIVMICLTCFLVSVCFLLTKIMGERKEWGIYYSCGFSNRDVTMIYIIQNILMVLIAGSMAFVGLKAYLRIELEFFSVAARQIVLLGKRMILFAIPCMACFTLTLVTVLTLIQVGMTWKVAPARLMTDPRG